jgi:uncharacterized membrane protein YfcA
LLATGAGAGFASGLLGIGGGLIMVPITYWVVAGMGISPAIAIRIAFGTSLLVMLPTAISGTWEHNKKKAIRWKAALILGPCGLVGALAGSTLAAHLSSGILKAGFGGFVLAVALWMGLGVMPKLMREVKEPRDDSLPLAACGFPIGMVAGLTGLGGGVLMVPALVLAFNFPMHIAIGTSVAAIIFTSLGGSVGYVINGLGVPGVLPHSIGYVNLIIWVCLAATSIPLARVGSRTAHALPAKQLRYIFIAFMVYVGLRMIGVF